MNYKFQRFLLMTIDPVHIGTGGYRLGRVDNPIAREPGTNLPKIPGTSLSGAIRAYAAYRYESPGCAGQGQPREDRKGHCGDDRCPICYTFGYIKGIEGGYSGVVNIFDAHIVLFPVHSMAGLVWVSTKPRLEDFDFQVQGELSKSEECLLIGGAWEEGQRLLNLGWLMLEARKDGAVKPPSNAHLDENQAWEAIINRLVLVTDKVFSQVVNSNLEVRTSVAINPMTGAADPGALFTYEAIPRATWLVMDAVEDDYRWEKDQAGRPKAEGGRIQTKFPKEINSKIHQEPLDWQSPLGVVRVGLQMMEYLGVGGMGTRGFGRVQLVTDWDATPQGGKDERAEVAQS